MLKRGEVFKFHFGLLPHRAMRRPSRSCNMFCGLSKVTTKTIARESCSEASRLVRGNSKPASPEIRSDAPDKSAIQSDGETHCTGVVHSRIVIFAHFGSS
jgi:hypothetical protein